MKHHYGTSEAGNLCASLSDLRRKNEPITVDRNQGITCKRCLKILAKLDAEDWPLGDDPADAYMERIIG